MTLVVVTVAVVVFLLFLLLLLLHLSSSFCRPSRSLFLSSHHTAFPMKIISWNVASLPALQGFIEHEKGSMRRFLDDLGVDIMCFQGKLSKKGGWR